MQFFIKATENDISLKFTLNGDETVHETVIPRGQMFEWDGTLVEQGIPEGVAVPSADGNAGSGYIERRVSGIEERKVFHVDVGDMPKDKAEEYLKSTLETIKSSELPDDALIIGLPDDGPAKEPEKAPVAGTAVTSLAEAIKAAKQGETQPETAPVVKKPGRKSNAQKAAEAEAAQVATQSKPDA